MATFRQAVDSLLHALEQLGQLLLSALVTVEAALRHQLALAGLPPAIQTVLLVGFALLLIVASLRLFGGLIRIGVVLLLILIALHIIAPVLPA